MLQTNVPGMGSALIHCPCLFLTCKYQGFALATEPCTTLLLADKPKTTSTQITINCVQHVSRSYRRGSVRPLPHNKTTCRQQTITSMIDSKHQGAPHLKGADMGVLVHQSQQAVVSVLSTAELDRSLDLCPLQSCCCCLPHTALPLPEKLHCSCWHCFHKNNIRHTIHVGTVSIRITTDTRTLFDCTCFSSL